MSPPSASAPPPVLWAFYDLALAGRQERLQADRVDLQSLNAVVFVAGQKGATSDAFLDGLAIEREWQKQNRWRGQLEALRTDLASNVDGEVYLRAARRAVWLAAQAQSASPPALFYGGGVAESLAAWLVGRLLGTPFVASLEDDRRWTTKMVNQLQAEARAVRDDGLAACITTALSLPPSA